MNSFQKFLLDDTFLTISNNIKSHKLSHISISYLKENELMLTSSHMFEKDLDFHILSIIMPDLDYRKFKVRLKATDNQPYVSISSINI